MADGGITNIGLVACTGHNGPEQQAQLQGLHTGQINRALLHLVLICVCQAATAPAVPQQFGSGRRGLGRAGAGVFGCMDLLQDMTCGCGRGRVHADVAGVAGAPALMTLRIALGKHLRACECMLREQQLANIELHGMGR